MATKKVMSADVLTTRARRPDSLRRGVFPQVLAILSFLALCTDLLAQDTTYYDSAGKESEREKCAYFMVRGTDPISPDRILTLHCYCDGRVQREERHLESESVSPIPDGLSRKYFNDGSVQWEREFAKGHNLSNVAYWKGGRIKRKEVFERDSLVAGSCFKEDGSPDLYRPFMRQPEYKGGQDALLRYMRNKTRYPKKAIEDDITGTVYVSFVVAKDGTITNCRIARSVHPLLDAEALKVVSEMKPWTPGTMDDEPINCRYSMPVVFVNRGGYH